MRWRVVFDSSALVGAVLHDNSIPHRAWMRAQEQCKVLACDQSYFEIETVLRRPKLRPYIDQAACDRFLRMYRDSVEWVEVMDSQLVAVAPACRDSKDNLFLALADGGRADAIIASDQDLLVLHPWRGIAILTPAQFLAQPDFEGRKRS